MDLTSSITHTGWWLVESEGEVGWAPALYLEPADEMTEYGNIQTFQVGRGKISLTLRKLKVTEIRQCYVLIKYVMDKN